MKAIIFLALLLLLPLSSAQTLQDNSLNIDQDFNGGLGINETGFDAGQYFQAQSSYILKQVSVYQWVASGGNPVLDYEVDIYRTTSEGSPIYLLARNFSYSLSSFYDDPSPQWRNISFGDIQINEGEYYGIFFFELTTGENSTSGFITWWHDDNSDTYPYGSAVANTGAGDTWTHGFWNKTNDLPLYFYDYSFMMWGEEIPVQEQSFISSILSALGHGLGSLISSLVQYLLPLILILLIISLISYMVYLILMGAKSKLQL